MTGRVTVGLVTALPIECAAARLVIDNASDHRAPGDPNHYRIGDMPSRVPHRPHRVVVALQGRDGTRNAAAICTDMARSFPDLRVFLMCGIAAGVPTRAGRPLTRPGDLAISTGGVVDYAHVRAVDGTAMLRRHLDGLSARLIRADRELAVQEVGGTEPWRIELDTLERRNTRFRRPGSGRPVVHRGTVGSADILLRDAVLRDGLAARYDLCAFEMEGSGIAVGADLHDRHWFMVRGICDHADDATKTDDWHGYAAAAAAAYCRTLLMACEPSDEATGGRTAAVRATGPAGTDASDGLEVIVDTLLGLRQFRDDYQRREVIDQFPTHIRTAVSDNPVGRLHVLSLVCTCEEFEDGLPALIAVLRRTMGAGSPELRRVADVVTANWARR